MQASESSQLNASYRSPPSRQYVLVSWTLGCWKSVGIAWHDASGYGEARRLRTLLAERDVPCPKCGFNLRGITCGACPECGLSLSTQMWSRAPSRAE